MKTIINGAVLAYETFGAGPAVLLLHDYPLSRQMWQAQIPALVGAGYRVVVPDLRGFGDSAPPDEPWSIADAADDVVSLMNYLGIGRAVICGCGLGASVLFQILSGHRARVAAACFIAAQSRSDSGAEKVWRGELADLVGKGHAAAVVDTFASLYLSPKSLREKPELLEQVQQWMTSVSTEGLVGGLMAMKGRPDFSCLASQLDVPALILCGEQDRVTPPDRSLELASAIPRSHCYVLAGAGHLATLEVPEEVNQELLDFLFTLSALKAGGMTYRKVA